MSLALAVLMADDIFYSDYYMDDDFEYRHVILPAKLRSRVPEHRLLQEEEWRGIGVKMSQGWTNYAIHPPEKHILLFKRLKNFGALPDDVRNGFIRKSEETIRIRNIREERIRRRVAQEEYTFAGNRGVPEEAPRSRIIREEATRNRIIREEATRNRMLQEEAGEIQQEGGRERGVLREMMNNIQQLDEN